MQLQFEYKNDSLNLDKNSYFESEGNLPFDANSKSEMEFMIKTVAHEKNLNDEYSLKRLEVTLKYDLPFFATNRRLVKNWVLENFIF